MKIVAAQGGNIIESPLLSDNEEHAKTRKNIVATRHARYELSPSNDIFSIAVKPKDYKSNN